MNRYARLYVMIDAIGKCLASLRVQVVCDSFPAKILLAFQRILQLEWHADPDML